MYPDYYNMYNQYYGNYEINYRSSEPPKFNSGEIITLNQAITLIRQSVGDEKEDEMFYDTLIEQAPTQKEKDIIRSIRDDERKHNKILRELYYEFTGQILLGELDAVSKYRKILGTMPSGSSYTLLMSIMTDELRHASKYNFLIQNTK